MWKLWCSLLTSSPVAQALVCKHLQASSPHWVGQDSLLCSVSLEGSPPRCGQRQEVGNRNGFHHYSSASGCCLLFVLSCQHVIPLSLRDIKEVGSVLDWQRTHTDTQRWHLVQKILCWHLQAMSLPVWAQLWFRRFVGLKHWVHNPTQWSCTRLSQVCNVDMGFGWAFLCSIFISQDKQVILYMDIDI